MDYNKLTVKKLRDLIKKYSLVLPTVGSGKHGNIIKPDLVYLLKTYTKLESLPLGPTLNIIDNLDPKSLIELCKTNKNFTSICSSKNFWKKQYERQFQTVYNWKKLYMFRASIDSRVLLLLKSLSNFDKLNVKEQMIWYQSVEKKVKDLEVYLIDIEEENIDEYSTIEVLYENLQEEIESIIVFIKGSKLTFKEINTISGDIIYWYNITMNANYDENILGYN